MLITPLAGAILWAEKPATFDAELELERALNREAVAGDLAGAMEIYRAVVAQKSSSRELAARALLGLGRCQERLGRRAEARATYDRLIQDYSDQPQMVSWARARIASWEQPLPGPRNLRFDQGVAGKVPPGWIVPALPKDADFFAELRRTGCRTSGGCAILRAPTNAPSPFAILMQSFSASAYRGKTVRLRAWLRLESLDPQDHAQMFLSVDRANRQTGFFDNMSGRPLRSAQWTKCEIAGPVDADASFVNFGFMSVGKGAVWVDEVSFEVLK
ncbi:MAG: tetratricopeptide repeat protein [Acidobacteriia bacterium]|nr:tetratricopeptide repeat protein [Terriglobia bacterium]MBV8902928.1 tetratricopeptide repeat protein [Terriglobia bacterium]